MKNRIALRVVGVALFVIGLTVSIARADSYTLWCQNGEMFIEQGGLVMSLGYGELVDGNRTTSCIGDRIRTVYHLD